MKLDINEMKNQIEQYHKNLNEEDILSLKLELDKYFNQKRRRFNRSH